MRRRCYRFFFPAVEKLLGTAGKSHDCTTFFFKYLSGFFLKVVYSNTKDEKRFRRDAKQRETKEGKRRHR